MSLLSKYFVAAVARSMPANANYLNVDPFQPWPHGGNFKFDFHGSLRHYYSDAAAVAVCGAEMSNGFEGDSATDPDPDPQAAALAGAEVATHAQRRAAPSPQQALSKVEKVSDPLFQQSDFFNASDRVQVKYEMLRHVRVDGQTVADAAAAAGMSRPAYYDAQAQFKLHGLPGLVSKKRGPHGASKMSPEVLAFIEQTSKNEPDLTIVGLQERLGAHLGVSVHRRTIERAHRGKKNPS